VADITREQLDASVEGRTIASAVLETIQQHGERVALRERHGDGWREVTYAEYGRQIAQAAAGLRALGVGPGDRVVLMMRNVPDFHVVDMAVLFLGATAISVYNSSSADQVAYLTGHCRAKVALVEDDAFLDRFLSVRDQLPQLESIVTLAPTTDRQGALTREAIFGEGDPLDLAELAAACDPNGLVTVIYTSGTTGPPKGVKVDHRNVLWTAEALLRLIGVEPVGFRVVSYLPMAHIAERLNSHYLGALAGYEVTTCPDPSKIAEYAREVHPQLMFGVPRVWEKIYAGLQAALGADADKKKAFDEAVAAAIPISERKTLGESTAEDDSTWEFLDSVAFSQVRELVGLDALTVAISGAAPIPAELITWFRAIGVPLSEIYGMSESTGIISWEPYRVRAGSVGLPFPGTEVFLAEDGEVCCRGGNVFLGYLDDPDKTAEALDPDGTLHSGDIGSFDDDGYLSIIDRKKELIITAGGKNISPANLEAALKLVPLISQACAIGDDKPFVSALVVLDGEVAPVWAKQQGIAFETLADLAEDPRVVEEIDRGVQEAMAGFNNAERVKKVKILAQEWLPDSEELTPTSKLKRRGIHAKYAEEIAGLYG